ncbi:MAG: hypothetical protein ACLFSQ_01625 [Candidatus Zixiibacteriota bacterium]
MKNEETLDSKYRKILAIKSLYHAMANEYERAESIREFLRSIAETDKELSGSNVFDTNKKEEKVDIKKKKLAHHSLYYAIKEDEEKATALRHYLRSKNLVK